MNENGKMEKSDDAVFLGSHPVLHVQDGLPVEEKNRLIDELFGLTAKEQDSFAQWIGASSKPGFPPGSFRFGCLSRKCELSDRLSELTRTELGWVMNRVRYTCDVFIYLSTPERIAVTRSIPDDPCYGDDLGKLRDKLASWARKERKKRELEWLP